jgi:hypothetical protein
MGVLVFLVLWIGLTFWLSKVTLGYFEGKRRDNPDESENVPPSNLLIEIGSVFFAFLASAIISTSIFREKQTMGIEDNSTSASKSVQNPRIVQNETQKAQIGKPNQGTPASNSGGCRNEIKFRANYYKACKMALGMAALTSRSDEEFCRCAAKNVKETRFIQLDCDHANRVAVSEPWRLIEELGSDLIVLECGSYKSL